MPADANLTILGPFSLNQFEIGTWWNNGRHSGQRLVGATIAQIIGWYISEGTAQGVRGDLAFAQACLETGYLTNSDTARNNFAGIAHYDNAPAGTDFATPQTGVRAHIQLLAKVVGGNQVHLAYPNVVPTWGGRNVSTVAGLAGNWASDPTYAGKVISVFNSMLGGRPPNSPGAGGSTIPTPPVSTIPLPPSGTLPQIDTSFVAPETIDNLVLNGLLLGSQLSLGQYVIGGSVDLAHDRISEFTFTVADPDLRIAALSAFQTGLSARWGQPIIGLYMTTAVIEIADGHAGAETTLTLRHSIVEWMARDKGALTESSVSATDFIAHRVSEYNQQLPDDGVGGLPGCFTGQPSAVRGTIERLAPAGVPQDWVSTLDLCRQLATQEGFWFFETSSSSGSCIFFGKPSWLVAQAPHFGIGWGPLAADGSTRSLSVPKCRRSREVITGDVVVVTVPRDLGEQVRVGMAFTLSGVYGFNADYLVTRVRWTHDGKSSPVEITGWIPVDPEPTQANPPPTSTPAPPPGSVIWPFTTKSPSQYQRIDQGWDLQTSPAGAVFAITSGILHIARPDPGGFGNDYPFVIGDKVLAGAPSDTVYYGHVHVQPGLDGKHVDAGQVIATTNRVQGENGSGAPPGWLEIGFATHATGAPVQRGSGATASGRFMQSILLPAPLR